MKQEFELIELERPVSAESVRRKFNRMNLDPLDKIMEKYDASGVRWWFNQKNLRKRRALEK